MPGLVSALLQRGAFGTDDEYKAFCSSLLTPSLALLAVSVGNDLLWKPMNHSLLMATRDTRISNNAIF